MLETLLEVPAFTFDRERMELVLNGQKATVHRFSDDPEMPCFRARPIVTYMGYQNSKQTLYDRVYAEDKMSLEFLIEGTGKALRAKSDFVYHELKAGVRGVAAGGEAGRLRSNGENRITNNAANFNSLWIGQLQVGKRVFFSFLESCEAAEVGLSLHTARALLRAGHFPENLFSANPDETVVSQLALEGVVARQGDWATSFPSEQFGGIYLDLCFGSLTYICAQLELATYRAYPGCVLGLTVTGRDFNCEEEPLLLRSLSIQEFLIQLGWRPALQGLRASSTLLHGRGQGREVLTQVWRKK